MYINDTIASYDFKRIRRICITLSNIEQNSELTKSFWFFPDGWSVWSFFLSLGTDFDLTDFTTGFCLAEELVGGTFSVSAILSLKLYKILYQNYNHVIRFVTDSQISVIE